MPSKTREKNTAIAARSAALPKIPQELLDQFVRGPMTAEAIQDVSMAFKKALIERALGGELSHHLGYPPGGDKPAEADNHRNGSTGKTVLTEDGPLRIEVPRDRQGSFEPLLIPKHERRFTGFDDKIVAMYARGMTVREIQGFLAEQYGTEVSPEFISSVTDAVMAEVTAWQSRPLEPMYPVVFFDALRVKIREDAVVRNKAIYPALGILPDGTRDILGLWIENTEGAKFWMKVFNDLKTRGVADILIAVTDGLKGIGEALAVLPDVPTIDEVGVKGYDMGYWFAAYVPAGTPAPVVARLNEPLHNALKSPVVKAFFEASGGEPFATTPEALAKFQQDETAKWGKVIKTAGIEAE